MTGKRSLPQPWWGRRDALLAAGGTALAVWVVVGAWMLVHPGEAGDGGPTAPGSTTTSVLEVPSSGAAGDGGYDPGVYNGPLNTPKFTPHPSRTPTATKPPSTGGATSTTQPTPEPQPTATTTGPGKGHGHGHGKKP